MFDKESFINVIYDKVDKNSAGKVMLFNILSHPFNLLDHELMMLHMKIDNLWEKKDEPIENQADQCISEIYQLVK